MYGAGLSIRRHALHQVRSDFALAASLGCRAARPPSGSVGCGVYDTSMTDARQLRNRAGVTGGGRGGWGDGGFLMTTPT